MIHVQIFVNITFLLLFQNSPKFPETPQKLLKIPQNTPKYLLKCFKEEFIETFAIFL
jgi:hypothetical protein